MAVQVEQIQETSYKFIVAQFEQMIAEGIFAEDDRVELIDGEIITMSPINHPHAAVVSILEFILHEKLGRRAYVWAQQPLWLDDRLRPQPDVAFLRWRDDFYAQKRSTSKDVLLIIEVADSSLSFDCGRKRAKYARAGIGEYWIVNLRNRVIEVYSNPAGGKYEGERIAASGDVLTLPGGLEGVVGVDEVFLG
jgi:Uma2 family endonuclease